MAIEWDFVADLGFFRIDPGVREVGLDFAFEVDIDGFQKGHVFDVAEICVGLRLAF
ncbi:hypothetical protein SBA3_100015 [Candidatus Sulfopaludibacter sp. SbA3]|nr:hypothetical protein SBA3_100015 [Candidatus Sulfopaludibacter sp. SbA3]